VFISFGGESRALLLGLLPWPTAGLEPFSPSAWIALVLSSTRIYLLCLLLLLLLLLLLVLLQKSLLMLLLLFHDHHLILLRLTQWSMLCLRNRCLWTWSSSLAAAIRKAAIDNGRVNHVRL
jgi:hypothetical protein